MRSVTFTSDNGRAVTLTNRPPFFMSSPPKYTAGSSAQVVKPPGGDGQDSYGVTMDAGNIFLSGSIVAIGDEATDAQRRLDLLREQLCFAFHPKYTGTLTYCAESGTRRIRCRAPALPTFGDRVNNSVTFALELVADDPTWRGGENVASAGANYFNHRFPWFLPTEGAPFSLSMPGLVIFNPSPVDAVPVVEIYETYGQLVEVENETTSERLKVNRAVGADEKLVIDLERVTVWLWRNVAGVWSEAENGLNWLDEDSGVESFRLVPGENKLSVNQAMIGQKPVMILIWAEPFVGV